MKYKCMSCDEVIERNSTVPFISYYCEVNKRRTYLKKFSEFRKYKKDVAILEKRSKKEEKVKKAKKKSK